MFLKKLFLISFLGAAALSQTACSGGSGFVQGVNLGSVEQNGVEFIEVRATLNTQGLLLLAFNAPIFDPKNPTQLIGQVSVQNSLTSNAADLSVLIRSDVLPDLPAAGQGVLPNGTLIPVAGVDRNKWISIPIGSSSRVYLNIDLANSTAVLGTALGIDALTTGIVANGLVPFQSNKISGLAGIYAGPQSGQSGFAIFLNISQMLPQEATVATMARVSAKSTSVASVQKANIQFLEKASNSDQVRIQRRIIQLKENNARLRIR